MSVLSTLGNVMAQKTGIPPQAASVPGDQTNTPPAPLPSPAKIATPPTFNPVANIANAAGKPVPTATPATPPIGGPSATKAPAGMLGILHNTGQSFHAPDANDPQVQQQNASAAVNYYQTAKDNATAAKQKADTDVTTLTPQYTKAQQDVASLTASSSDNPNGDYEVASSGSGSAHQYNPQADGAPQLLLNVQLNGGRWTGTVYTLQPNGQYAPQQVNLSNNDLYALYHGKTAVFTQGSRAVAAFTQLASTGSQLKQAQAASSAADTQISTADTNLTQQKARLAQATNQIAQNTNLAGLGQSLSAIGGGFNSAYQTDVDQANQAKTALQQQAGLGTIGNAGAALTANAFGVANINQTNAQSLDVQHAGLVDQQAQQVGSALQSSLANAAAQSGLQLQTMQQDLSAAIQSLQNDLQYASGEQQIAIQNYINALQNEQSRLKNAIGGGAVTDQEVTQIGSSVASGVASAAAVYTASAKKNGTST